MAAYHFTWDLDAFHWMDAAIANSRGFHLFGHAIAASFLFLSGYSLVLARRARGTQLWRAPPYWRRWSQIVVAAAAISAVSFWLYPQAPIFFGILHCIALSSLLALPLVDAPTFWTLGVAALAFAAPPLLSSPLFDPKFFWWTGLSTFEPASNDYRPLLPWLAFVLLGVACARLRAPSGGTLQPAPPVLRPVAFLGRHSLAFYLIHQPVLFGGFLLIGFFGAPADEEAGFIAQCAAQCSGSGVDAKLCESSCRCVAGRAKAKGSWRALIANELSQAQKAETHDDAVACYAEATGK